MEKTLADFSMDEKIVKDFEDYIKDNNVTEEIAIRNLVALGLSYYYSNRKIEELERQEDFNISLRRELMATSAKYASLKFNYYEMKKDYDRLKLQVSGLIHENDQYQISLQCAAKLLKEYNDELKQYRNSL